MTPRFMARAEGAALTEVIAEADARAALKLARVHLGPRALVRREAHGDEPCVVLRAEHLVSGRRFEREYGRGPTWPIALQRAAQGYREMVAAAQARGGSAQ